MKSAILRIKHDLEDIKNDDRINDNVACVELQDGNLIVVRTCFLGPKGAPYESNIFEIDMEFSDDYPIVPPKIKFITNTDHPDAIKIENCITSLLHQCWTPKHDIKYILNCILGIFHVLDSISNQSELTVFTHN